LIYSLWWLWTIMNSILVFRPQTTVQSFIKFNSKLRPWERWQTHTHKQTQTDASDLINNPLICYNNGTDVIKSVEKSFETKNVKTWQNIKTAKQHFTRSSVVRKLYEDMISHFNTIPGCDRRTDRQYVHTIPRDGLYYKSVCFSVNF